MSDEQDVLSLLGDLERFMRRHADQPWADEFRKVQIAGAGNRQQLKRLVLDMYKGTMGSLTDLIITRVNGHEVTDEAAANAELDRMTDELWDRAKAL